MSGVGGLATVFLNIVTVSIELMMSIACYLVRRIESMMRSMISINSVIISSSSVTESVKEAGVSLQVVVSTAWPVCPAGPHSWLQPSPAQQQNSRAGCVTSWVRVQGVEQPSPVSQHPWDRTSWPSRRVWQ